MVSIKEVENLNKRIEKINNEYTKKKTQQDLLKDRLEKELKAYKEEFGVNLGGSNMAEIKRNIEKEHKEVVSRVEEEYKEKLQIVQAIEEGDYEEAGRLLGIEPVQEEVEEVEVAEEEPTTLSAEVPDDFSFDEEDNSENPEEADFGFGEMAISDEDDESEEFEDDDSIEIPGFEDDVEEMEVSSEDFLSSLKGGSSVADSVKEVESSDEIAIPEVDISGLEISDDDDDEEIDFGFGDMLSGTKFES